MNFYGMLIDWKSLALCWQLANIGSSNGLAPIGENHNLTNDDLFFSKYTNILTPKGVH